MFYCYTTHCQTTYCDTSVFEKDMMRKVSEFRNVQGLYKDPASTRLLRRHCEDTHLLLYLMFEKGLSTRVYVEYGILRIPLRIPLRTLHTADSWMDTIDIYTYLRFKDSFKDSANGRLLNGHDWYVYISDFWMILLRRVNVDWGILRVPLRTLHTAHSWMDTTYMYACLCRVWAC